MIYLYSCIGQPWKAAQRLRQVVSSQYGNHPDSLCGNDDCGQMSAWYIFTCLGFYPVCPASDYYVIGAPQIPKAVMRLSISVNTPPRTPHMPPSIGQSAWST